MLQMAAVAIILIIILLVVGGLGVAYAMGVFSPASSSSPASVSSAPVSSTSTTASSAAAGTSSPSSSSAAAGTPASSAAAVTFPTSTSIWSCNFEDKAGVQGFYTGSQLQSNGKSQNNSGATSACNNWISNCGNAQGGCVGAQLGPGWACLSNKDLSAQGFYTAANLTSSNVTGDLPGANWACNNWLSNCGGNCTAVPTSTLTTPNPVLTSPNSLTPGQMLLSVDNSHIFVYQADGNIVIYSGTYTSGVPSSPYPGSPIWSSNTSGKTPGKLTMQADGNLVSYSSTNTVIWNSNTSGKGTGPYQLVMQHDGNLVIYDSTGAATWSSGTSGK
jgi:hypothetical protein